MAVIAIRDLPSARKHSFLGVLVSQCLEVEKIIDRPTEGNRFPQYGAWVIETHVVETSRETSKDVVEVG
jgi:hypothetical protein